MYIVVDTTQGHRYLIYQPIDEDHLGDGLHVHHGIGSNANDGQWHTFVRDLQKDIRKAQPTVIIAEVNGFLIRGNGRVDDIQLIRN